MRMELVSNALRSIKATIKASTYRFLDSRGHCFAYVRGREIKDKNVKAAKQGLHNIAFVLAGCAVSL